MVENPYKSPADASSPSVRGRSVLRIIAVCLWAVSALPLLAFLVVANHPGRTQSPSLFVTLVIIVFVLPAIGLALLGFASWRRSRWLALAGVIAFGPIVLVTIATWLQWRWWWF